MDEPAHPMPADDAPTASPPGPPPGMPTPVDLWLVERERRAAPAMEPVLREIADVVERLEAAAAARGDAQALHLLRCMALCEDMERFETLADELARHLARGSAPARQRATRTLLKL